ncbi:MAG: hypothetical protein ACI9UK_000788 [Candidatus Krumholzibacteriia bacterium]|jgi:hypothetical protein
MNYNPSSAFDRPQAVKACVGALLVTLCLIGAPNSAYSWGFTVHRMLNRTATTHLPAEFAGFGQWVDDLESQATAADERKCCDSNESNRHYIDIDDYPEFFTGTLPQSLSGMVAMYGQSRVDGNGVGPWALDDQFWLMVQAFQNEDWSAAVDAAADIGHYAGDMHNPMHLTLNYNGQLTGQNGIHSRHESQMTGDHIVELEPFPSTVGAYGSILEGVFDWIDVQFPGVDMILAADLAAKSAAGGSTSSNTYYDTLWQEIGPETTIWLQDASEAIATIWYTAWLEAGSPLLPGSAPTSVPNVTPSLVMKPLYPNPFNPATTITFEVEKAGQATVTVHNVAGHLVRRLFESEAHAGLNTMKWDGRDDAGKSVTSGTYLFRVEHGGVYQQQKAALVR